MEAGKKAQVSVDDTYSEEVDDYSLRRVLQGALCQNKGQDGLVIFWTALPVPTLSILTLPRATEPWARMRAASATLWIGRKILWATSTMKRGEIWWVNFDSSIGSEIRKTRPAVIGSNDTSNQFSKRVQVVPATSNTDKLYPPECHAQIKGQTSKIMADRIMTVSRHGFTAA